MHLFPSLLFSTLLYSLQCLETRKAELQASTHTLSLSLSFLQGKQQQKQQYDSDGSRGHHAKQC